MSRFETLSALLHANRRADRRIVFIDGEDAQRSLSFAELHDRALAVLGSLQRRGLRPGGAVVLFLTDNERFVEMFWACVLGGLVPVPIAVGAGEEHRRKLFRVCAQFERVTIYSDARTLERMDGAADGLGLALAWQRLRAGSFSIEDLEVSGTPGQPVAAQPRDLAFIQYSSGSTSEPKGVCLTHANLGANIASIIQAAAFTDRDVALSWMPLTHDMGLIGFHLNMLACGASHAILRTEVFARRPLLWLRQASALRATVLCSPNFGYEHTLRQLALREPADLDLSAVRLIFNGAEPISAELCERFTRTLAAHRLPPRAMFPVYGLAEASLAVSFPAPGEPVRTLVVDRSALRVGEPVRAVPAADPQALSLVLLGRAVPGTRIRIADPAGTALTDGLLGHVLIQGDNVTAGYWHDAAASARAIRDGWLDTGDLGLIHAGELVIAGRAKDVIFVNGQNWYPHDLETLALQVPGIEANKVVAAGVSDPQTGSEQPVLFVLDRGPPEAFAATAQALRRLIGEQTGLDIAHVVPVPRIPKTTSGKLQRHALARAFEAGEFAAAVAALAPPAALSEAPLAPAGSLAQLQAICRRVIPDQTIDPETDLLAANLSSLKLARLHEAIDEAFPGRLEVADLFEHPSLAALAARLDGPRA